MHDKTINNDYNAVLPFLSDMELLVQNARLFNGEGNPATKSAETLLEHARTVTSRFPEALRSLVYQPPRTVAALGLGVNARGRGSRGRASKRARLGAEVLARGGRADLASLDLADIEAAGHDEYDDEAEEGGACTAAAASAAGAARAGQGDAMDDGDEV